MSERTASCSCGAVRATIAHDPQMVVNCHCTMCRKMNGGAFSTMVAVPADALSFTAGEDDVAAYALTASTTRHFCTRCGTPLYNVNARMPGFAMLYLGALDRTDDLVPMLNVYCSTKLGWVDGLASAPSFDDVPDGG